MQKNEDTAGGTKNVKVYVRILPLLKRCENCAKISDDKKTIYVRCLQDMRQEKILQPKDPLYWSFVTDGIFYYSTQEEIYRETTSDIINDVLGGANFVLVSCGQTGTGKSFTTGGLLNNWEHRGLVPRLVADLMIEKVRRKRTNRIHYSLSYVEFRGRKFKDLLTPNFEIFDSSNSHDAFKSISKVSIKGEQDALQHVFQGEGRRALAEISGYPVCHLGTSVITFHVHNISLITSRAVVSEATIHIVEMAGIDNTGKSSCSKPARDVIAANSIKLELEQYFANLGKIETIPSSFARSSCLLKYLSGTLSFNSIIRFIAHVRVTREDLDVSLSTLRFVGKMAGIETSKVSYNVKPQSAMFVEKLQDEIERLKIELSMNEMFFRQEALMNISTNRARQIEHDFLDFLNGTISDIELVSLSQTQILARVMRDLYAKINAEKEVAQRDAERCENALKNVSRVISKTNVQSSAKGISRKNSNPKDLRSFTSAELSEESENDKVGALDDDGITLGPGISEIPAISAARVSNLMDINKFTDLVPSGRKSRKENVEDTMNEESEEKRYDANMRRTFERLQEMLKRLIEVNYAAGSPSKKPFDRVNRSLKNK